MVQQFTRSSIACADCSQAKLEAKEREHFKKKGISFEGVQQ